MNQRGIWSGLFYPIDNWVNFQMLVLYCRELSNIKCMIQLLKYKILEPVLQHLVMGTIWKETRI